ncbi:hypothetical protein Acr_00g0056300 [Actinidia rufa]|uniref:Uncharacterized protein n=1 Tax=Actinidia rufa TaxID=165716 RepID=A0A7J0DMB3_9ERIC|nr:hypothetical protein Acr_00g0056300 [Actinidia rufa]
MSQSTATSSPYWGLSRQGFYPCEFREQALKGKCSLSIEVSHLIEGTTAELALIRKEAEGHSTGSSKSSSSNSSRLSDKDVEEEATGKEVVGDKEEDAEVEEGEEVNQATNNLIFPVVAPTAEDLIEHSFNKGGSLCSNSNEEYMVPKHRVLGKLKVARAKLAKQANLVLVVPSPKEGTSSCSHRIVADLAAEGSEEFKERMIMQGVLVASDEVFKKFFDRGYNRAGDSYEKWPNYAQVFFQEGWETSSGGGEVQGVVGDEREGVDKGNPPKE